MALADPKKAKITHILSDGTVLDSVKGYPVYLEDAEPLIRALISASERKARKEREKRA